MSTIAIAGCSAQPGAPGADDNSGGGDAGGDTGGGGGGGGELCSTVREDEVADLSGGEVSTTELSDGDCSYTIGEGDLVNVRYESSFDPNLETARMICDDGEDVSGIGDQAIWCPSINVLYFNKGDRSVAVQLVFMMSEPDRELKDIASDIGSRVADGL